MTDPVIVPAAAPVIVPAAPQAAPAVPPAADLSAEMAALKATLAQQSATIASLSDESARRRIETKTEREAREAADVAAGNFKSRAERLEAEHTAALAKIAALEPVAQEWTSHRETLVKSLDAECPAHLKPLYDMQPNLQAKQALVAAFKAQTPAVAVDEPPKQPGPPAPPGGAPPGTPAPIANVDIGTMSVEQIAALKRDNRPAYDRLIRGEGAGAPTPKGGFLGGLFSR